MTYAEFGEWLAGRLSESTKARKQSYSRQRVYDWENSVVPVPSRIEALLLREESHVWNVCNMNAVRRLVMKLPTTIRSEGTRRQARLADCGKTANIRKRPRSGPMTHGERRLQGTRL